MKEWCPNMGERIYNNARMLTKLMAIHRMDNIKRNDFNDYFDDTIEMAFIDDGNTVIQLLNGDRVHIKGLADTVFNSHYGSPARVG